MRTKKPVVVVAAVMLTCGVWAKDKEQEGKPERWAPGIYKNIPLPGAPNGSLIVELPGGYDPDADKTYPVLFQHDTGGRPKTYLFRGWCRKNGVILIGVGGAKNGPSAPIMAIQKAAVGFIEKELKVSQALRFSTGMSGAAQMSWLLATTYPDKHAGILMCGQAGHQTLPPKHVCVAYVHGTEEPNNPYIEQTIKRLKQQGNPVRDTVIPGGHVMGGGKQHNPLLAWMLETTRLSHPNLSEQERSTAEKELRAQVEQAKTETDTAKRLEIARRLLAMPGIKRMSFHAELKEA